MPSVDWNRVQSLFLAAVDLPEKEQRRLLESECGGDPVLVAEIDSLLQSDRKQGLSIAAAVEQEASLLFDTEALVGDRLGAYRVIREIGRGGMGTVFLAVRDDDQFRKQVAIKVVKRGMDTREVLRRFRHERQILANLDHPYISRLLDAGTTPDGRPFFVMEWVEGQTLDVFVTERKLDIPARCRLFVKILEAVAHAHRNLVVHLDLKPANILITSDGTPKLLDFGVGKLLRQEAESGATVTTMARPFTPEYASPEQVRGESVSTATDIYSLGAVFYELLTAQRAQLIAQPTPIQIHHVVCEKDVQRPSLAARGLDGDLDNIVLMAMRKEPERRYRSVDQLAEDISRHLEGRTVMARLDSRAYRLRKFFTRNRYTVIGAALVAVSLIFGLVVAIAQSRRADTQRKIAEFERARAEVKSREAEAQSRAAEKARANETEQRRNADRERDAAVQQRAIAENRILQMLELLNNTVWRHHDNIAKLPGAIEARRQLVKNALEFLERLQRENGLDDRVQFALASAYLKIGDLQGDPHHPNLGEEEHALQSYRKAQALAAPLYRRTPNDPEVIHTWLEIEATLADLLARPEDGVKAKLNLLPVARHLARLAPGKPQAAEPEANIEGLLAVATRVSDPAGALEHANRHNVIFAELVRRFPEDLQWRSRLGAGLAIVASIHQGSGRLEQAADYFQQSIRMREPLLDSPTADVEVKRNLLVLYGNYGTLLGVPIQLNLGRFDEARTYCGRSVALARKMASDDPDDNNARFNLAVSLSRLGMVGPDPTVRGPGKERDETAWKNLEESLTIFEPLIKSSPKSARIMKQVGTAREFAGYRLWALGRTAEAEAQFQRGIAEAEPLGAIAQVLSDEEALARLYASAGDGKRSIEVAQRAIARAGTWAAADTKSDDRKVRLARAHLALAAVQQSLGNLEEAWASATRAESIASDLHDGGTIARQKPYHEAAEEILRYVSVRPPVQSATGKEK